MPAPSRAATVALTLTIAAGLLAACSPPSNGADRDDVKAHKIHSKQRERPPKVDPGPYPGPQPAPADAIVLFDGQNMDQWRKPKWTIEGQAMKIVPRKGAMQTKKTFGDCQLHIEFRTNPENKAKGQGRSNSGVFFGKYYEVQVLDNFQNKTYADGMCGALYGQYPPLVNASRPPGQWQTYDIIYDRPRFKDGQVIEPATFTVFHNGVLIQNHEDLVGPCAWRERPPYEPHGKLPIKLQAHGNVLWYKNIWIRELE
jgi:hypothetical protein